MSKIQVWKIFWRNPERTNNEWYIFNTEYKTQEEADVVCANLNAANFAIGDVYKVSDWWREKRKSEE